MPGVVDAGTVGPAVVGRVAGGAGVHAEVVVGRTVVEHYLAWVGGVAAGRGIGRENGMVFVLVCHLGPSGHFPFARIRAEYAGIRAEGDVVAGAVVCGLFNCRGAINLKR